MSVARIQQLDTYTDFSGLNALKNQASKDRDASIEAVSRQFESMFISMMLKGMREANKGFSEGSFLDSKQTEFYQQMFDSQLSVSLSQGQGLGLRQVLMQQLSGANGGQAGSEKSRFDHGYQSIADYPRKDFSAAVSNQKAQQILDTVTEKVASLDLDLAPATPRIMNQTDTGISDSGAGLSDPQTHFDSPDEFVAALYPLASKVAEQYGLDPRLLLAQSALETGWGQHQIYKDNGEPSYNLFGIKANPQWQGNTATITTTEYRQGVALKERADFRAYNSYEDSFKDYVDFLKSQPRYQPVFAFNDDPEAFADALQQAGYATDPAYGDKIGRILKQSVLAEDLKSVPGLEQSGGTVK